MRSKLSNPAYYDFYPNRTTTSTEMIKELIANAARQELFVSTIIRITFERTSGNGEALTRTADALSRMNNQQGQAFCLALLSTIQDLNSGVQNRQQAAADEIANLFGMNILNDEAMSHPQVFFTLSGDGKEFSIWYAPFGKVTYDHFNQNDGKGCLLTARCESAITLDEWLQPFIKEYVEWTSGSAKIWMGHL